MKKNTIILAAAAAIIALASCSKQAGEAPCITIQAGIGTMTKVSYSGDKASFASGDKLSVYAWTGDATAVPATLVVNGVVNTFDGSKWTPASQMLWEDKNSRHYFLGISPERAVTDFKADAYTLDPANFAASDLLVATNVAGMEPSLTPVDLNFGHILARLDVNLTFRSQWDAAPTVTAVKAMAKKTATVDYLAKALTATGTAEAVALTSKANDAWSGLQVPQSGVNTITITIGGKDYVFNSATDIPLVGGKFTTVNLAVGRDKIELSDAITISDWASQGAAIDGDALEDPYNGHEYVDLGLSVKWATCNVGAAKPEGYGDHVAWGETAPKTEYNPSTYFDKNYTEYSVGGKTVLAPEDDAATANWGALWRMPTLAEWKELVDNCNTVWTTQNGVNGCLFTSNKNGATLFLPAAGNWLTSFLDDAGSIGDYWSSSLSLDSSDAAFYVFFNSSGVSSNFIFRNIGLSVRPVTE